MKTPILLIVIMIVFGMITLYFMINMDRHLWEHVDQLTPICQEDEFIVKVKSYREYNGIIDVNGKYNIKLFHLMSHGNNYYFYEPEKVDSIVKFRNQDSIFFYLKGEDQPIRLKGDFACIESEQGSIDE